MVQIFGSRPSVEALLIPRPAYEAAVRSRVQDICSSDGPGLLMVYGEGGIGKTTLLQSVLFDKEFLNSCGVSKIGWLNVYQLSRSFEVGSYYHKLADLFQVPNIDKLLDRNISSNGKILLVLDDVYNIGLVQHSQELGNDFRIIFISRQQNFTPGSALFVDNPILIEKMSDESLHDFFKQNEIQSPFARRFANFCDGLPLVAGIISSKTKEMTTQEDVALYYKYLNAKSVLSSESSSEKTTKTRTIGDVLLFNLIDEAPENRRRFYTMLAFEKGDNLALDELAVLWQCDLQTTTFICQHLVARSLVRSVGDDSFAVNSFLHEAALNFAWQNDYKLFKSKNLKYTTAQDWLQANVVKSLKNEATGENVLHMAAKLQRAKLLNLVLNFVARCKDRDCLFELCSQRTLENSGSELALQTLLNAKVIQNQGKLSETNVAFEAACNLTNQLLIFDETRSKELLESVCESNQQSLIQLIISTTKDPTMKWYQNALHVSFGRDYRHLAVFLVHKDEEVDINSSFDDEGNTAFHRAALYGSYNTLHQLASLEKDREWLQINVSATNRKGETPLMIAAMHGKTEICEELLEFKQIRLNVQDKKGNTALIWAAYQGKAKIADMLLRHGASIDVKNNEGETALYAAATCMNPETAKLLYDKGARLEDGDCAIILLKACFLRKARMVELLNKWAPASDEILPDYELIAKPLVKLLKLDHFGNEPLLRQVYENNTAAIRRLLQSSDQKVVDSSLFIAAFMGYSDVIRLILSSSDVKADPNLVDKEGLTSLIIAASNCHFEAVSALMECGADVRSLENIKAGLMVKASGIDCEETIARLLKGNADINVEDENGITPLIRAAACGYVTIAQMLVDNGAALDAVDSEDYTALAAASDAGFYDVVKILTEYGASLNIKSKNGWSPLTIASCNGYQKIVELLINNHADVNSKTASGATALTVAAQEGHAEIVKTLLESFAKVNDSSDVGWSPLFFAAQEGHEDVAKLLVINQADVHAADEKGVTPLFVACEHNHVNIARMFIENGADVNAADQEGFTPLLIACHKGFEDIAKLLIDNGAEVNVGDRTEFGTSPLISAASEGFDCLVKLLLEKGAKVDGKDSWGSTALIESANHGKLTTAKILIDAGADVNATDEDAGRTALMLAARCGHKEIVTLLLEKNANVNAKMSCNNCSTSLLQALYKDHEEIADILIDAGADINLTDHKGATALSYACEKGFEKIVKKLLDLGADVNMADGEGDTPLMYAVDYGQKGIAKLLIEKGANVNAISKDGLWTPLFLPSYNGNAEIVQLLIDNGATVNVVDDEGKTPLLYAAEFGHAGTVKILLENGADVSAVDNEDNTALSIAQKEKHEEIVKLLITNGAQVAENVTAG